MLSKTGLNILALKLYLLLMWKRFGLRKDVTLKLWSLSKWPLFGAILYGITKYFIQTDDSRNFINLVGDVGAAFFFFMWLAGQYLRTGKSIDDMESYETLQTGIDDLKRSISSLSGLAVVERKSVVEHNSMIKAARGAIDSGHVIAGLMQAGVAFEQAIVQRAQRQGRTLGRGDTIARTLKSFERDLEKGVISELFGLWKLRNQLVHLSPEAAKELENRPELIDYFEWGISTLDQD